MSDQIFWMVWNPRRDAPKCKHYTEYEARNEAQRLAAKFPGETFVVLRSLAEVKVETPHKWKEHTNDMPF